MFGTTAASVIRRIEAGDRVKIVRSRDGREQAVIRHAWIPMTKVVQLSSYEITLVEVALTTRRRRAANGAPAKSN